MLRASDGPDPARRAAMNAVLCAEHAGAVPDPPAPVGDYGMRAVYLLGDSHMLATAWRTAELGGGRGGAPPAPRLLVPRLVTGLSAWHMREGTRFLTVTNLGVALKARGRCGSGGGGRLTAVWGVDAATAPARERVSASCGIVRRRDRRARRYPDCCEEGQVPQVGACASACMCGHGWGGRGWWVGWWGGVTAARVAWPMACA